MTINRDCINVIKEIYPDINDETALYILEQNTGYPWFLEYPQWGDYLRTILRVKEKTYQKMFNRSVLQCVLEEFESREE